MRINDSIFLGAIVPELDNGALVIQQNKRILFLSLLSRLIEVVVRGVPPLALPDAIADSLAYLKAFGGTEQRNVPSGYTEIEYIETTTGTEYIDPQVTGNARWVVTAQTNAVKGSSQSLIASTDSASGGSWYGEFTTTGHWDIKSSGTNIASTTKTTADLTFDGNGASGTIGSTSVSREIAVTQGNWRIFGTASGIGPYVGKLFSAKVYQNGVLVRDFVPAIAPSAEVGLYDKISGQFFTNAGTGTFTAGADVTVPTPDTPMDIVSNNGVLKANKNLYGTEYNGYELSQVDGITLRANSGVNVSGMVDCRTIKSFKITTASPQGSFRTFKYRADNTYIDANSTANIGDIITLEDNVGFFRIQYNFTNSGTGTQNILIYNSAYDLNGIYADGTVETINVHGKNLFDKDSIISDRRFVNTVGSVYNSSSDATDTSGRYISALIPVQESEVYIKNNTADAFHRVKLYDSNKICLRYVDETNTITIQQNEAYMAISGYLTEINTTELNQILGTAVAEMLLKIGNYEDVQEIISGVVTRKVGVKVLDGTEDWTYAAPFFSISLTDVNNDATSACLCTHYLGIAASESVDPYTQCVRAGRPSGTYNNKLLLKDSNFTSTSTLTAFLADQYNAGTPVIVVYPLATPTTESVAGQTMQVQQGDNFVEITQASLDNLELEAKYQAAVSLTIQEVQDANLDPNVQVTIN